MAFAFYPHEDKPEVTVTEYEMKKLEPSVAFFDRILKVLIKKHHPDWFPKSAVLHPVHFHSLAVLRECPLQNHYNCVQSLFVQCPQACDGHWEVPISHARLSGFLKRYFDL